MTSSDSSPASGLQEKKYEMTQFEGALAEARTLDKNDPLCSFKDRFYIRPGTICMDGNSCGLCSKDAEKYLLKALEDWKKYYGAVINN